MSGDMAAGLTLGSLFDGIAGFPLAAAGLGIKTMWTSELNRTALRLRQGTSRKQSSWGT